MISDRQMSRLFWAIKAALAVLLLYAVVAAVVVPLRLDTAFKPNAVAGDEPVQAPDAVAPGESGPADHSAIVANDLFMGGTMAENDGGSTTSETLRSAENLGLRLVGVVAGGPVASRAVIESDQTKSAQPYKIGDTVASATIESIEPDRVILLYAGQRRVLVLRAAAVPTGQSGMVADLGPISTGASDASGPNEPLRQTSARLSYVEDIFRTATVEPYVERGRTEGLRITGLDQNPLAATFGLRNGDIVRTVNGQDLTSKQKAFQVLMKARTQPKLDIELVRDGKTKNLSFDL